jgi:Ni,Fe-hydrogenase I cytochrome b subunit
MARRRPRQKVYQHPLLIRITHWLNTIALTVMVLSGLRIFWAYQAFNLDSTVDPRQGYTAPALVDLSEGLRFNLREAPFDTLVPVRFSQAF